MLQRVIGLVRRAASGRPPETHHDPATAGTAREDRAATVLGLRGEVRALQQEITDASDAPDGAGRVTALEADLTAKQRELAKLQGRV